MIRLFLCLLGAVIRPARANRTDARSRPAPSAAVHPIPRQARHTLHAPANLVARDHPGWRVFGLPTPSGHCYVAARGAHLVRADGPEEARRRIRQIDEEPPLWPVRPYVDRRW